MVERQRSLLFPIPDFQIQLFGGIGLDRIVLAQTIGVNPDVMGSEIVLPDRHAGEIKNRLQHALHKFWPFQQKERRRGICDVDCRDAAVGIAFFGKEQKPS